jgi:Colicin V production protein
MIWILALLVLASGVGLGMRLGVIPTTFSFIGIVFGTLLAGLLAKLFGPLMTHMGLRDSPLLVWAVAPIVGFFFIYALFMAAGFEVHRRVDVYYRYKAGDLRQGLWERLNHRLGACMGVLAGTAWLVLISFGLFNLSYWTSQIAPSDNEAKMTRLVNNLGQGLQSTGLDRAARAVGDMPDKFYKTANFAGFLAQNQALTPRLATYPAFLSVAERDDIQSLAQDSSLTDALNRGAPMGQIMNDPQVQSILKNTNLMSTVWGIVQTNMDDITNYLISGKSPMYSSDKIIGRWSFDLVPALAAFREANPKIRPNDMKAIRALWSQVYAPTTFVAGTDGQAFLKNVPDFEAKPVGSSSYTYKGDWTAVDANYLLSLSYNGKTESANVTTDGLRLTLKMGDKVYVFERID